MASTKKVWRKQRQSNRTRIRDRWLITISVLILAVLLFGFIYVKSQVLKDFIANFPFRSFAIVVLVCTGVIASVHLAHQVLTNQEQKHTDEWVSRNLMLFWYVVWDAFTLFWMIGYSQLSPEQELGAAFPLSQYLLLVVIPSFFPVSAIAYTLFQNERKLEALEQQLDLLGSYIERNFDITARYQKAHSTVSFFLQTVLPVLLSVIGVYLLMSGNQLLSRVNSSSLANQINQLSNQLNQFESSPDVRASDIYSITQSIVESQDIINKSVSNLDNVVKANTIIIPLSPIVVQALSYGFLGAYIFSIQLIYRRYTTLDLKPSIYMQCTSTLLAGFAFNYVLFRGISDITGRENEIVGVGLDAGVVAVVAFALGYFPGFAIRWFNKIAYSAAGTSVNKSDDLPLSLIEGLSDFHEVRLRDEGIDNIQNLAVANIEDLIIDTPFNILQLVDWIDQAILRMYLSSDTVDAFRRGGVRGISDFRYYWEQLQNQNKIQGAESGSTQSADGANAESSASSHSTQPDGEEKSLEDNKVVTDGKDWAISKASFATRLQTTQEQLEFLYFATMSAPNLAYLDYPRRQNKLQKEYAETRERDLISKAIERPSELFALIASTVDRNDFIRLLEHIAAHEAYVEVVAEIINVFGGPEQYVSFLNEYERERYALPLARWYYQQAKKTDNAEEYTNECETQAHRYYELASRKQKFRVEAERAIEELQKQDEESEENSKQTSVSDNTLEGLEAKS